MLLMIFLLICFLFAFLCKFLSCAYVPQPRKFTAFIDESVEKNKSISSKHGDFKILPYIARKRLFEQIIRNYPF